MIFSRLPNNFMMPWVESEWWNLSNVTWAQTFAEFYSRYSDALLELTATKWNAPLLWVNTPQQHVKQRVKQFLDILLQKSYILYVLKKHTFNAGDHQQNQQQHHQDCVEGVGHGRLHPCRHTQTLSQKSELTFEIIGSHSNDILYLLVV